MKFLYELLFWSGVASAIGIEVGIYYGWKAIRGHFPITFNW